MTSYVVSRISCFFACHISYLLSPISYLSFMPCTLCLLNGFPRALHQKLLKFEGPAVHCRWTAPTAGSSASGSQTGRLLTCG